MTELIWTDWWLPVVAGPFVGSFLGVLVTRLPAAEPVIAGRFRCPIAAIRWDHGTWFR
jgi:hypothetical protein